MPPPAESPEVELELHPDAILDLDALRDAAATAARLPASTVRGVRVLRRSIDARRGRVRLKVRVAIDLGATPAETPNLPVALPAMSGAPEVAIVGAGPAGLFCALALARLGIRSTLFERGKEVRGRRRDLAALTQRGELDPESNYCFGEGGAGTFSDGKLYTRSSKRGDVREILEAFVAYGASPEILVDARPHIGTNKLPGVITRMREHLASAGVDLVFGARVDGLEVESGRVRGVRLAGGDVVDARAVVLATGHSARDVQRFVAEAGAEVRGKGFAIGVRVEHPQAFIDRAQFGDLAGHPALGAASYRLVERAGDRGVFSFCMCPGGFIAPAATERGGQVVNGWSPSKRNGHFANSGLVVEVGPRELAAFGLDPDDAFAGVRLQRRLERAAFDAGGGAYQAPGQRLDDLLAARPSSALPVTSYPRPVVPARLDALLGPLGAPLREAIRRVERRMPGFASPAGVAVGLESRTSSPVRFERDRATLEARGVGGLYPSGEGAGFAGGIMSAALDGARVAEAIARALR